jgi:hypothetical protein
MTALWDSPERQVSGAHRVKLPFLHYAESETR